MYCRTLGGRIYHAVTMACDIEEVQRHLKNTVEKLEDAEDPDVQRELVVKLRLLLKEADRAIVGYVN